MSSSSELRCGVERWGWQHKPQHNAAITGFQVTTHLDHRVHRAQISRWEKEFNALTIQLPCCQG